MSTFRQLPSGKWYFEVRRAGLPCIAKSFASKTKGEEWARSIEVDIDNGVFAKKLEDAALPTLSEVMNEYGKLVTPLKKGKDSELYRIGKLSLIDLAQKRMPELTQEDFANYRDKRIGEGAKNNTVRLELALFSVVFNWYINERNKGSSLINPVMKVKKPKAPPGRERRLTPKEEEKILQCALGNARKQGGGRKRSPEFLVIVLIAADTAMRFGEILRLEWKNLDLEKEVIYLRTGETKNDEKRGVPLSPRVVEALRSLPKDEKGGRVFHYTSGGFKSVWYDTLIEAKVPIGNLHFHDLRHESTSKLFEDGGLNVIEVASITGHKDLKMLKRYTHLNPEDLKKKLYNKPVVAAPQEESVEVKLEKLVKLLEKGLITQEVFDKKQMALLDLL